MIRNYFKTAWRNIRSNRLYSLLNIAGLAVAMTACFMLLLYVHFEMSYDHQNEKLDRIYQVYTNFGNNNEWTASSTTPVQVADVLKKDFPAVEKAAVTNGPGKVLFSAGEEQARLETLFASASLAEIFTFRFLPGSTPHIPADASSVVISRSTAKRLFGKKDAIGQTLRYDNKRLLKITGIFEDLPVNSSLQFDAVVPWEVLVAEEPSTAEQGWYNYGYSTYLLARENADIASLDKGVGNILLQYDNNKNNKLFIYPFAKVHLYDEFKNGLPDGGRIRLVRLMLIMAAGILLIGCINFMNMSTARSVKRAREVGVRKAIGAPRKSLIMQFLGESVLMATTAFALALAMTGVLLPVFNRLLQLQLTIPYENPLVWLTAAGVVVLTGGIAGSYPAFFLSSFQPVKVLKGSITGAGKASVKPRQALVVVQFTFSICLILSSIIIYRQVQYVKDRPLGYQNEGLIEFLPEGNLYKNFEAFRREAIQANAIVDGTVSGSGINESFGSTWGVTWPGQVAGEEKLIISQMATSYHFVSTMGLSLAQGRDFSEAHPSDSLAVILNQAAVKMMRLEHPLGQTIRWQGENRHVVGVVNDFSFNNPFDLSKPMVIGFKKDWIGNITLKLNPGRPASESLAKLDRIFEKINPGYPFEYHFTDEIYARKFHAEQMLGNLALAFTLLSVLISCLGLFGLAAFSAEQRQKEIGIRKVLGARVGSIWLSLSREFIALVVIAFVIGATASSYIMQQWLLKYEYHTGVSPLVIMTTFALALVICLLTVSFQAIKAALTNPVKSLRTE
ncbi:MAG: ABC transporter permease [Leadbetterella sp.]|nr:ABC transporter permease [Leadbetterella sp.]